MSYDGDDISDYVILFLSILFLVLSFYPVSWIVDWARCKAPPPSKPVIILVLHNFISITVSVIMLCIKIFVPPPNHVLNIAMKIVWTAIQGIAVILLAIEVISPGTFDL